MGLTLVIDEIIAEDRTYSFNKTLRVVDSNKKEVTEAYFAIKQIKYVEKESNETFNYTFKNKTSVKAQKDKTKIADIIRRKLKFDGNKKYTNNKKIIASFTKESYKAKETITIKALKKEKRTYYLRVDSGSMGNQMYLVVETKNLKGKKVKLKIHETKNEVKGQKEKKLKLLKNEEAILPILVFAKKEDKTTNTEANDWIELDIETVKAKDAGAGFYISEDNTKDKEVGIKKIQLRPKEDKDFKDWAEKLYIREDETEAGKKKKKEEDQKKKERNAETFVTLTRDTDADKKENRKSYPKKISGTSSIEIDKIATYSITKYSDNATKKDKNNIRWSLYIKGDAVTKYTIIDNKSKAGLYTYAKMELVEGKNQLTIIFDKALKGKKVQIEPFRNKPDIDQSKKKGGYDYIKTTTIKEKPTPKISILDTTKLWLETQCDDCKEGEKDKEFLKGGYFKLKTPDTIHIYSDGKISKVNLENLVFEKKINYVYHDRDDNAYKIATCKILEIEERLNGKSDDKKTAHTVITGYDANNIVTYSHDSSRKKYSYTDGTVRTYGKFYNPDKGTSYRLVTYKKGSSKKYLIKMPSSLNKNVGKKSIIYSFTKTARRYCGPEHFAAFIGALAEDGYTIKSGGACEEDGTCYPSVSHVNGQSVDTSYLSNTEEQKFINAMYKFGFKTQLRGSGKKAFTHTKNGGKLHNNHLHSGKLKPNYK